MKKTESIFSMKPSFLEGNRKEAIPQGVAVVICLRQETSSNIWEVFAIRRTTPEKVVGHGYLQSLDNRQPSEEQMATMFGVEKIEYAQKHSWTDGIGRRRTGYTYNNITIEGDIIGRG